MKITGARVILTCPGRNFVTLKIETEDGLTGLGDATLNGRELAIANYLESQVAPALIGRDAQAIEDIWQQLYRGAYWRRGPVTMAAIGAVDVALWDLKAKLAGLPLYQLLGGACRPGVMVYGHAEGAGIAETVEAARRLQLGGYKAVRLQSGAPPAEPLWSTAKYLPSVPKLFEAAREALGWDIHLLHDVDHRLSPIEAGRLGKDLEPWRPFWLEDPIPAENLASFRLIRQHTTTPLAVGEAFNTIWDAKQLIEEQLIDYIRATVVHAGGVTHLRRIASLAELYGVRTGCHGSSDLSPVCMGAALHFDLSTANFGIQEYVPHAAETDAVFPHAYRLEGGEMHPGEAPGHGVELDEALAARFPYRQSSDQA